MTITRPLTTADLGLPPPHTMTAALPLFIVAVLVAKRRLPRAAACFGLVAGTVLSAGLLYRSIQTGLRYATAALDWVTRSTVGGIVPGAVAIMLMIYFVVEIRPATSVVNRLATIRSVRDVRALVPAGGGYRYGDDDTSRTRYRRGEKSTRRSGRPDKLGALAAAVVLPSVVHIIPGTFGVISQSIVNLIAGG